MTTSVGPFISFQFSPEKLDQRTWFLLGEAFSKCLHLTRSPIKPALAAELSSIYLARGVQATTAIEGNTLSEQEVKDIVDKGSAGVSDSREYLEQEAKNILEAIAAMDRSLREGVALPINSERLCALNEKILEDIPESEEVQPGHLRTHNVRVGGYRPPDWQDVPKLVQEFCTWLQELRSAHPEKNEDRFVQAVLAAVLAHLYMAWIHPFGNGNGRLARLIEVQILSESGVVPLVSTNLLSDDYNKTRTNYYHALDRAQHNVGDFVRYAVQGLVDELREQVAAVQELGADVHWESYIHETFQPLPSTDARARQRELALAMPADRAVSAKEATELTTSLAKRYAVAGGRTPMRDLNTLVALNLITKEKGSRFRSNKEVMRAFMPPVAP